jgi:hypothetical protein
MEFWKLAYQYWGVTILILFVLGLVIESCGKVVVCIIRELRRPK